MVNDIFDENGDGSISGTAQSDVIYGGTSAGNANGGPVINDTIDGGQSDDTVYGGDGDDLIFGGDAGDAAGSSHGAKSVERFEFDIAKADAVVDGGQSPYLILDYLILIPRNHKLTSGFGMMMGVINLTTTTSFICSG